MTFCDHRIFCIQFPLGDFFNDHFKKRDSFCYLKKWISREIVFTSWLNNALIQNRTGVYTFIDQVYRYTTIGPIILGQCPIATMYTAVFGGDSSMCVDEYS